MAEVNRFGPYQVHDKLGAGGMAVVYKATQTETGQTVALKILRSALMEQPGMVERFLQEVTITQRLRHPNIVPITNSGAIKGRYFLEMPYMSGGTLAQRFAQPAEIHSQEAVRLLRNVAASLDYAHQQHVIHRDLKLENILLNGGGHALLADFSIARIRDASRLTATGHIIGTPLYISPEQARGAADVDHRADLYALGVIAYVLSVGRFPFVGSNPLAILNQHLREPVPPPTEFNPALPHSLDAVLVKALAKSPNERYQSADMFVEAFARAFADAEMMRTFVDLRGSQPIELMGADPAPHGETAEVFYQQAVAASDPKEAIRLLKRALELEPLHSKANRLLFQLEGATPVLKESRSATPAPVVATEPLRKAAPRQREHGMGFWISISAVVVLGFTLLVYLLYNSGTPLGQQIGDLLTGKRPVTQINGTPVQFIPNVVLTVSPYQTREVVPGAERMRGVAENGIAYDYTLKVKAGRTYNVVVVFSSPTATRVNKQVAVLDANGLSAESRCRREPPIDANMDISAMLTCTVDADGVWRVRVFGVEGESTGDYFVRVDQSG